MISYIDINKDAIPYRMDIVIIGETFNFTFHYNEEGNYFTCDLCRGEDLLAVGEKFVYGSPLFSAYADQHFPKAVIIPGDISGQSESVTWATLGSSVFLYLITPEEYNDAVSA